MEQGKILNITYSLILSVYSTPSVLFFTSRSFLALNLKLWRRLEKRGEGVRVCCGALVN